MAGARCPSSRPICQARTRTSSPLERPNAKTWSAFAMPTFRGRASPRRRPPVTARAPAWPTARSVAPRRTRRMTRTLRASFPAARCSSTSRRSARSAPMIQRLASRSAIPFHRSFARAAIRTAVCSELRRRKARLRSSPLDFHPASRSNARFFAPTSSHLEDVLRGSPHRAVAQRLGNSLGHDSDDRLVRRDEDHIEWNEGVSHPKRAVLLVWKDEEHRLVWRELFAPHQPASPGLLALGDLRVERMGAAVDVAHGHPGAGKLRHLVILRGRIRRARAARGALGRAGTLRRHLRLAARERAKERAQDRALNRCAHPILCGLLRSFFVKSGPRLASISFSTTDSNCVR